MPYRRVTIIAVLAAVIASNAPAASRGTFAQESSASLESAADQAWRQDASAAGFDPDRLGRIGAIVTEAIRDGRLPGAVILVERHGRIVYHRAFGHRAVVPAREVMTLDTIFDLASLTKSVATAPSVMLLVEEGRLRLADRVASHLPGFERHGKGAITIRQLLTHTSGLRPSLDLEEEWTGHDTALAMAIDEVPQAEPDEGFVYSDINFVLLAEIVARASGLPFERFAPARLFEPLGMRDTMFRPPPALVPRIAPTEACTPYGWPCGGRDAEMLRGIVHDPTARRMEGVAGHAGLFGTAADLARFGRMLLDGGELEGRRILSPLGISRMTGPATPAGMAAVRGLGWDIDSPFSSNRGDLFPPGSFGHTGFTGTSLWLDPASDTIVVFLSSRLHPDGGGDVVALRGRVATVVAAALTDRPSGAARGVAATAPAARRGAARTGIDVLEAEGFARLRGLRVGLLTNQTGRARDGTSTIDLLHRAGAVTLAALFSPEHGIRGTLDEPVASSVDAATGLDVHSLYGETRRPTQAMLESLDAVVVDLQDIGARFYTYMTTMAYVMEEAARAGLPVVVLDRPNPITGVQIEGPGLDEESRGFTGYFPMPIRHGLTLGELARLFNAEGGIGADLSVVPMEGWRREDWFDETGLPWTNPSPNMRNLLQATLYPGIGAIEGTNLSVGRGTDAPFQQIGAPWIDGVELAAELNARELPGIRFYPVAFVPSSSRHAGERCEGVFFVITDRGAVRPVRVGLEVAAALVRLYGEQFDLNAAATLFGSRASLARVAGGGDPAAIAASWSAAEAEWRRLRARYLLYP